MARVLVVTVLAAGLGVACSSVQNQPTTTAPPLVDTLAAMFADMTDCVCQGDADGFLRRMHPDEVRQLRRISRRHGYSSLRAYLEGQLHGWPAMDTLKFAGLARNSKYARLALRGRGSRLGRGEESVRYTFLLFKRHGGEWRLAGMTALEKPQFDRYGHVISYYETDLPPKLRFPRVI